MGLGSVGLSVYGPRGNSVIGKVAATSSKYRLGFLVEVSWNLLGSKRCTCVLIQGLMACPLEYPCFLGNRCSFHR